MEFVKKIIIMLFLFLLSATGIKFLAFIFLEGGGETRITNILSFLFVMFLVKCCFYWLDTKNSNKELFTLTLPTQTNQLTPFITGVLMGIQITIRYFQA